MPIFTVMRDSGLSDGRKFANTGKTESFCESQCPIRIQQPKISKSMTFANKTIEKV